jgi:cyclase
MAIPALQPVAAQTWASLGKLGSNNGVIATPVGLVLVDVPHKPTDAVALSERLRDVGEVTWIIHTDHHIDHTLTNGLFDGTVVAHEQTGRRLRDEMPTPVFVDELLQRIDPHGRQLVAAHPERTPTVLFSERLELELGGTTVRLVWLPGHTPNTIGIHVPDRGVFFAGDSVSGMGLTSFQESNIQAWRVSIDRVLALDFDTLIPGHGPVGDRSTARRFRDEVDEFVGRVDAARTTGMGIDEAVERIRFEDRIHTSTETYTGYPCEQLEEFQRRSVRAVYTELEQASTGSPGPGRPNGSAAEQDEAVSW